MKRKMKKVLCVMAVLALMLSIAAVPVWASTGTAAPDIAGALKDAKDEVALQAKDIYNNVIVPILCIVLAIALVVRFVLQGLKYKQEGHQIEWTSIIVLAVCLIIAAISPTFVPALAGW